MKVRAGECAPSRVGSSPGSGPARRPGSPGSTEVPAVREVSGRDRSAECVQPGTAVSVDPCGRDTVESGAATRSTKTRAKGGQSLGGGRSRGGTTEVDTAALHRLLG